MPGFAFLFFFLLCSSSSPLLTETISTSLLYVVGREGAGAAVRTLLTRVEGEAGWRTAAGRAARQLKLPRKASAALARRPSGRRGGRAHSSHVAGCPRAPGGGGDEPPRGHPVPGLRSHASSAPALLRAAVPGPGQPAPHSLLA